MNQKKGESLRKYIDCFKVIASRVTMHNITLIETLRKGLGYECRFHETLEFCKRSMLEDALHQTSIYVNIEEERESLHKHYASKTLTSTKDKIKKAYWKPWHHFNSL